MPAVPGRLGDVELVGRHVRTLAGAAADLDIEGVPPLPVMVGSAGVAAPALAGGEVLEGAVGMERGQRAFEVVSVLGLEVPTDEGGKVS
jgi:hypothetical protein